MPLECLLRSDMRGGQLVVELLDLAAWERAEFFLEDIDATLVLAKS